MNYLDLPGASTDYLSTADFIGQSTDFDLRVLVALDDWTPATRTTLSSQWTGTHIFRVNAAGTLELAWHDGAQRVVTSTAATGFTDGTLHWVRATLDGDNGASGHDVKFWTSDNGTDWTQLGDTVNAGAFTSQIRDGTGTVFIGLKADTSDNPVAGNVYYVEYRSAIDGTVIANPDFRTLEQGDWDAGSATDDHANTWTLAGTGWVYVQDGQFARPSTDDTIGDWTTQADGTTNLFQTIDEAVRDDDDYIKTATASVYRTKLSTVDNPEAGTRVVRYRVSKSGDGDVTLTVRLKEDTTTLHTWGPHTLTADWVTFSQEVTEAVTDYSNLFLEFERGTV